MAASAGGTTDRMNAKLMLTNKKGVTRERYPGRCESIALRSPCFALALGNRPWSPVQRMRVYAEPCFARPGKPSRVPPRLRGNREIRETSGIGHKS
jgi:hypothetical protein